MSGRFVLALVGALGATTLLAPATAQAGPHVKVAVATPRIVATTPHIDVKVRPARPGPGYVWVDGYKTHDRHGHHVWVPGHWERRTRSARVVTVRSPVATVKTVKTVKVRH